MGIFLNAKAISLMHSHRYLASQNGVTPLGLAAFKGHKDFVVLLLDRGAMVDHKNNVRWLQMVHVGAADSSAACISGMEHTHTQMNVIIMPCPSSGRDDGIRPCRRRGDQGFAEEIGF